MISEQSRKAFNTIKDNGLLSKRRFQFYEIIYEFGPITIAEALKVASRRILSNNIGSHSGRFSELEKMGVIESVGVIKCKESRHENNQWVVTSKLPKQLPKASKKIKLEMWDGFYVSQTLEQWAGHVVKGLNSMDPHAREKGRNLLDQLRAKGISCPL